MSDRIRLACVDCDSCEHDGIGPVELAYLETQGGWTGVYEYQSYKASRRQIPLGEPGVLDWFTHLGRCPSCSIAASAVPIPGLDLIPIRS